MVARIIALEEHFWTPALIALRRTVDQVNPKSVERLGELGALRLREMDAGGIDMHIHFIAPHHRDDKFLYFVAAEGDFPEFMAMLATGTWILGQVAADVVADYFAYYAHGSTSAVDDMLHRMRADLHATASKFPLLQ